MAVSLTSNLASNTLTGTTPTTFKLTASGAIPANLTWYFSNTSGGGTFYSLTANTASVTIASGQAYSGSTNGWYFPDANTAMTFKVVDSGNNTTATITINRVASGGGGGTLTLSSNTGQISGTTSPTPTSFTVSATGYSNVGSLVWYFSNDGNLTWNILTSGTSAVTIGSSSGNAVNGWYFPEGNTSMGFRVVDNGSGKTSNTVTIQRVPGTSTANGRANVLDYGAISGTDSTTAFKAAIAAVSAAGGGTVYVPAGTYTISDTLIFNNVNLTGDGISSKIVGSSSGLGASKPMFLCIGVITVTQIYCYFDAKPSSASTGQYVIFKLGDSTIQWYVVQRHSLFDSIWTGACGTAYYCDAQTSPNPNGVFSTTFSNLRVENMRYRGFDFLCPNRTGNVYSNIYLNTSPIGSSPNITTDTCNCLFSLAGFESESSLDQINCEWATFTYAAMNFQNCHGLSVGTIHFEHLTPASNNIPYIRTDSSSGVFNAITYYGNYWPDSPDPTATGTILFQLNSCINHYGAETPTTASYFMIHVINIANMVTSTSPLVFARGTNDGTVNVDLKALVYNGSAADSTYWQAFPKGANVNYLTATPINTI